ncbi:hypothetical protein SDC9_118328 [bioreactor metagenome]|uniref:Uncharacterized protein n=1 Tax=bioreactor metagenome TaxID=1076179 RepID=A0A645C8V3_9ZZZZ
MSSGAVARDVRRCDGVTAHRSATLVGRANPGAGGSGAQRHRPVDQGVPVEQADGLDARLVQVGPVLGEPLLGSGLRGEGGGEAELRGGVVVEGGVGGPAERHGRLRSCRRD